MLRYPYGKIELHCHIDGSLRPETVYEILKNEGEISSEETLDSIREKMICAPDCTSLDEYLERFALPGKAMQTRDNIIRVTYELMEDLSKDGVVYAELRFAPQFHTQKGLTQEDALQAVLDGVCKAEQDLKTIRANVIVCLMRMPPQIDNTAANDETYRLAREYKNKGVILDLAGAEAAIPMNHYASYYKNAKADKLSYTVHAGEAWGAENVNTALDWSASRIGHGCRVVEDQEVMKRLKASGSVLEICPISNIQTKAQPSFEQHAIRRLKDYGIRVCVNTDNRTVSDTTLEKEYQVLEQYLGFTMDEFREMNRTALQGAFLSNQEKAKMIPLL